MTLLTLATVALASDLTYAEHELPSRVSALYADTGAEVRAKDLVYDALFYRNAIS